jgi:hypothetical protein
MYLKENAETLNTQWLHSIISLVFLLAEIVIALPVVTNQNAFNIDSHPLALWHDTNNFTT